LVDVPALVSAYYTLTPDLAVAAERVAFGTSGHRGSSLHAAFNEGHILATTQALCEYRRAQKIDGPLFLGKDTHALSEPALRSALEVLAAHEIPVLLDAADGYVPTPSLSHAILTYNRGRETGLADGIVVTPSHNPPDDGGFKYNPPNGGPAGPEVTGWVEKRANEILAAGLKDVKRIPYARALKADTVKRFDYVASYVNDLDAVIDMKAIAQAKVKIGVDPMGGAGVGYWEPIAARYGLDLTVVQPLVDPTFRFLTVDKDGKLRMDCSSPAAMAGLVGLRDRFALAFGNDADADRHGIVTPSAGLLNPNHYLSVAIFYLFSRRKDWPATAAVGKTMVSSSLIDRVAKKLGRRLAEVPVGFKNFVDGLISGAYGFGGEESAGASLLRRDGTPWTTDKDGIALNLLAAEITAVEGQDPGQLYKRLTAELGEPAYERIDVPATPAEKNVLKRLAPQDVQAEELAGERIKDKLTAAPENGAALGGLKVVTESGWFAARPSGTENVYKIYAESFLGADHLARIQSEAKAIVAAALAGKR
jgi:phosphoglucomutase